jgi:hypothetical protein
MCHWDRPPPHMCSHVSLGPSPTPPAPFLRDVRTLVLADPQLDKGVDALEADVKNATTSNDQAFVDVMGPLLATARRTVGSRVAPSLPTYMPHPTPSHPTPPHPIPSPPHTVLGEFFRQRHITLCSFP